MTAVNIQEGLWREFTAVARRRGRKPEDLAQKVLRDFLRRAADEELLTRSERAARRRHFRIEETEELIRQHRRAKRA